MFALIHRTVGKVKLLKAAPFPTLLLKLRHSRTWGSSPAHPHFPFHLLAESKGYGLSQPELEFSVTYLRLNHKMGKCHLSQMPPLPWSFPRAPSSVLPQDLLVLFFPLWKNMSLLEIIYQYLSKRFLPPSFFLSPSFPCLSSHLEFLNSFTIYRVDTTWKVLNKSGHVSPFSTPAGEAYWGRGQLSLWE